MRTFDVAIIGGGVIGASIAFELAEEKIRAVVLDQRQPGREASWAAAGMLSPAPHAPADVPLTSLGNESLGLYPGFISRIEEISGCATDFARDGSLEIFFSEHAELERDRNIAENRRLGVPCEPLCPENARKMEGFISPAALAAMWLPAEATVDPRLLTEALLAAGRRRGVEIRSNCQVTGLVHEHDHCHGVVAGAEKIIAEHTVVAAGCFCGRIAGEKAEGSEILARFAPTRPVRGQMLALRPTRFELHRVVRSKAGYLVPRRGGPIVAGSTLEEAGFEKQVTAAGVRKILESALELLPELTNAEILETWAGLRPGTPDGLPILGPTEIDGLVIATGHYRNGILLAPVTAKLIRQWITGKTVPPGAEIFSPMRFTKGRTEEGASKIAVFNC